MPTSGTYQLPNSKDTPIYQTSYGFSGGITSCINTTVKNENINTIGDIQGIGDYTITCTATSNTGKISKRTETYKIEALLNANYKLYCTSYGDDKCYQNNTQFILPPSTQQYGPYFKATKGCYYIVINGSNFQNGCMGVQVYHHSPYIEYNILSKTITSTKIDYYVNISDNIIEGSGVEFAIQNWCSGVTLTVDNIIIYSRNSCPSM